MGGRSIEWAWFDVGGAYSGGGAQCAPTHPGKGLAHLATIPRVHRGEGLVSIPSTTDYGGSSPPKVTIQPGG